MYIKTNWLRSLSVVLAGALLLTAVGSYLPPGQNISPSISSFVNASPVKQLTELEKAYNWPDQGNSDHYMEFVPDEDGKVSVIIGFTGAPARGAQRQSSLAQQKSLVEIFGGDVGKGFTIINAVTARLPLKAVEALSKRHEVSYLEPDYKVTLFTQETPWGIDRIFGPEKYTFPTWDHSRGEGIAVAVLDTGIDEKCVDLPALLGGVNTIDSTHWGSDEHGHGTHVAGIIAAVDNDIDMVGAAPDAGLYSVKVMDDSGWGTYSSVIAGIEWVLNKNIPIMNMSIGGGSHSKALKDAVDAAYAGGTLLVAAAGNQGNSVDNVLYPARYSSVIAVSASDSNNNLASFSSRGPSIELIAPGDSILSLIPGNSMGRSSGTSMAAPHVAGSAALLWGANPELSNVNLRNTLRQSAEDLGLSSDEQGYGLVRADLAVAQVLPDNSSSVRLSGANRYQTAISIAKDSYPETKSADAVVIARGDVFADALPGGVLAYKENGPLLLTRSQELIADVGTEINRVLKEDGTIYILGSTAAISASAEKQLKELGNYQVNRIAGRNRTETAYKIAKKVGNSSGQAIIAYSHSFPDALAISSYAARKGIPILTSDKDILSTDAQKYLTGYSIDKVYVVGDTEVISAEVFSQIEEIVDYVERFGGANRYETNRLIADEFFPSPKFVGIAYGRNFPDALAGGVNAAKYNAPIMLVDDDSIPPEIEQYLKDKNDSLETVIVYGGTAVIKETTKKEVEYLIK